MGAEGGSEDQLAADAQSLLAGLDFERARRRARLALEEDRRRASHEVDRLLAELFPPKYPATHFSERWERNVANELVAAGFDSEYIARRYRLTMRGAA
jgi:hypothetical protein